ncbi:MAG: hypothetical protein WCD76_17715 [Pyrinomonadaceae bacterium]
MFYQILWMHHVKPQHNLFINNFASFDDYYSFNPISLHSKEDSQMNLPVQPTQPVPSSEICDNSYGVVKLIFRNAILPAIREKINAEKLAAIRKNQMGRAVRLFLTECVLDELSNN